MFHHQPDAGLFLNGFSMYATVALPPLCMDQYIEHHLENIPWNRNPFLVNESLRIRDQELLFGLQKSRLWPALP